MIAKYDWLRRTLVVVFIFAINLVLYGVSMLIGAALFGDSYNVAGTVLILATLVSVVLMSRIRATAESVTNWLAFGERANAYKVASTLATQIANTLAVDDVLPKLAETAARSTQSRGAEVRLWLAEGEQWRQMWPVATTDTMRDVTVTVRHAGSAVGELSVNPSEENWNETGRQMLDALARPAGLALASVKLTYELRQRLKEVQAVNASLRASQARIVEAHRRERFRITTEVIETVKPHLDASVKDLDSVESVLVFNDVEHAAKGLLDDAHNHGSAALEVLRRIAHGLYPVQLFNAGVVEAFQAWIVEGKRSVEIRASGNSATLRNNRGAEATLFFTCTRLIDGLLTKDQSTPILLELICGESDVVFVIRGDVTRERFEALEEAGTLQDALDQIHSLGGTLVTEVSPSGAVMSGKIPLNPVAVTDIRDSETISRAGTEIEGNLGRTGTSS